MALPITGSTLEFITLAEVKAQANVTSDSHDSELDRFRLAAQEHVENLIGPVLHRSVTETHRSPGGMVPLRQYPVVSVNTVTAGSQPLTGWTADGSIVYDVRARGAVTVAYTAGRTSCPEAVRVAALIIAEDLWRSQRGQSSGGALPGGALPGGVEEAPTPGVVTVRSAMNLLEPYLLPPTVA